MGGELRNTVFTELAQGDQEAAQAIIDILVGFQDDLPGLDEIIIDFQNIMDELYGGGDG
jgi:hypothetical protein